MGGRTSVFAGEIEPSEGVSLSQDTFAEVTKVKAFGPPAPTSK